MPSFGSMSPTARKLSGINKTPTKKTSTGSTYQRGGSTGTQSVGFTPTAAPPVVPSPVGTSTGNQVAASYGGPPQAPSNNVFAASSTPSSALPANGTNPYGGFMGQFNPGATQETIWRDPQTILNALFQQNGTSTASPMYSTLRDFYGADPQSLWLLLQGNKQGQFGGPDDYGNFLQSLYSNYMAPGGRGVDFNEILGTLGGLTDQSGLAAQDQSPLWQLLTSGGAAEQVRSMYGLVGDAARTSLSPAIASAFMDALARQSDTYLTQQMQSGTSTPYYEFFQNPMLGQ